MKRAILAALLASAALPAYAANINVIAVKTGPAITMDGDIITEDFAAFKLKASPVGGKALVILTSYGGNLVAALQIGEFIRLRGWTTVVMTECDSACALIWLGGVSRVMTPNAKIGFHAASVNGQEKGVSNALVGAYMNRLGLGYDAVAFATIAGPDDATYLTPAKAKEIGIEVSVVDATPTNTQPATVRPAPPQYDNDEKPAIQLVHDLIEGFNETRASANSLDRFYRDVVDYYGKTQMPKRDVLNDKIKFIARWPNRNYVINSVSSVRCMIIGRPGIRECTVNGTMGWQVSNTAKKSVGTSSFEYVLISVSDGKFQVAGENSKLLTRQITDLAATDR